MLVLPLLVLRQQGRRRLLLVLILLPLLSLPPPPTTTTAAVAAAAAAYAYGGASAGVAAATHQNYWWCFSYTACFQQPAPTQLLVLPPQKQDTITMTRTGALQFRPESILGSRGVFIWDLRFFVSLRQLPVAVPRFQSGLRLLGAFHDRQFEVSAASFSTSQRNLQHDLLQAHPGLSLLSLLYAGWRV